VLGVRSPWGSADGMFLQQSRRIGRFLEKLAASREARAPMPWSEGAGGAGANEERRQPLYSIRWAECVKTHANANFGTSMRLSIRRFWRNANTSIQMVAEMSLFVGRHFHHCPQHRLAELLGGHAVRCGNARIDPIFQPECLV
jgi:hypothetical protein